MDIGGRKADAFFEYPSEGFEKPRPDKELKANNEELRRVAELYLHRINDFILNLKDTDTNHAEVEALKSSYKDIKEQFDRISSGDAVERSVAMLGLGAKKNFEDPMWESTVEVKVANQVKFSLNKLIGKIKHLNSNFLNKIDESFSSKLAEEMQGALNAIGRNPRDKIYDNVSGHLMNLAGALEKVRVDNNVGRAESLESIEADFYRFSEESKSYLQGLVPEKYSLVDPKLINEVRVILEDRFNKLEDSVRNERYCLDLQIYVNKYSDYILGELRGLEEKLEARGKGNSPDAEKEIELIKADMKDLKDKYLVFVKGKSFNRFAERDPEGAEEIKSKLSQVSRELISKIRAAAPKPDNVPAQLKSILEERKKNQSAEPEKKTDPNALDSDNKLEQSR